MTKFIYLIKIFCKLLIRSDDQISPYAIFKSHSLISIQI